MKHYIIMRRCEPTKFSPNTHASVAKERKMRVNQWSSFEHIWLWNNSEKKWDWQKTFQFVTNYWSEGTVLCIQIKYHILEFLYLVFKSTSILLLLVIIILSLDLAPLFSSLLVWQLTTTGFYYSYDIGSNSRDTNIRQKHTKKW